MAKKLHVAKCIILFSILFSACSSFDKTNSQGEVITVGGSTESNGEQVWMKKNLSVSSFRNGDEIPEAKTREDWVAYANAEKAAWCYYKNDPLNGEKFGKLYNWYAVIDSRGLAPKGFHIPTDRDWEQLIFIMGGKGVAGNKLKSKAGSFYYDENTDSSEFSGLPGGYRSETGEFYNIIFDGFWWSSTEYDYSSAWIRNLNSNSAFVRRNAQSKGNGFSVRCLRN